MPDDAGAILTGIASILAAAGAIVVTVFNWLTSKDYGKTVEMMLQPTNSALSQASQGMKETAGLMRQLMEQQGNSLQTLDRRQVESIRLLERLDERTRKLDDLP
ncbi:hypothetical protein [Phycicoccus sp. SLBN-51]|uniref:hypothetical protein n=1 Tax=Phycicoccus sp. SLBN-51 TaxID=2768447 RepID=UPI001151E970|nr:hypothetical protein [Phycicoccus sp. SLBN-51]